MSGQARIGIVLSAGGIRGVYAHTGFMQTISTMDIKLSAMAGCSAGAIVGGIYSSGTPLVDWVNALAQMKMADFWKPGSWRRAIVELALRRGRTFTGIATTDAPLAFCRRNIAAKTFETCVLPFHTVATSLASGKKVLLSSGDLALGIAASASIPLLYQPVEVNGEYYCDGGVIDLGPTDAICCKHQLDVLIVHHVAARTSGFHGISSGNGWPILEIIDSLLFRSRPWYLSQEPLTFQRCPCGCNALIVVVEPSLPDLPWPQTSAGPAVQLAAMEQAAELLSPWLDKLLTQPQALLEKARPFARGVDKGGCRC